MRIQASASFCRPRPTSLFSAHIKALSLSAGLGSLSFLQCLSRTSTWSLYLLGQKSSSNHRRIQNDVKRFNMRNYFRQIVVSLGQGWHLRCTEPRGGEWISEIIWIPRWWMTGAPFYRTRRKGVGWRHETLEDFLLQNS